MGKGLKLKISARLLKKKVRKKSNFGVRRQCRFCESTENEQALDYKNAQLLKSFVTARGKILPSRISGTCCAHQRKLAAHSKVARVVVLLSYGMMRRS